MLSRFITVRHVSPDVSRSRDSRGGRWGRGDGPSDASEDEPFVELVAGVVSAAVLVVAFGLLAAGVSSFWVAFPVGYGGVLPLAVALARRRVAAAEGRETREAGTGTESEPLAALKAAYARGELDEAAFEERVERLLEDEAAPAADADLAAGDRRSVRVTATE
jgi:hypothetical protein